MRKNSMDSRIDSQSRKKIITKELKRIRTIKATNLNESLNNIISSKPLSLNVSVKSDTEDDIPMDKGIVLTKLNNGMRFA